MLVAMCVLVRATNSENPDLPDAALKLIHVIFPEARSRDDAEKIFGYAMAIMMISVPPVLADLTGLTEELMSMCMGKINDKR
jgi:hypothetical protein